MKKMKKSIIRSLLLLALFSFSCSEKTLNSPTASLRSSDLVDIIDSISTLYLEGDEDVSTPIQQSRKAETEENTSLKNQDTESIVTADAIGFCAGALFGAETGMVVGSVLGVPGSVAGSVLDALASGLTTAAICSIVAASDSTEKVNNCYPKEEWITSQNNILFDKKIVGGNLGWYHNALIQHLLKEPIKEIDILSLLDRSFQSPEEIPGISVMNFLKYAKNKSTGKNVKIFEFKDRKLFCECLYKKWNVLSANDMMSFKMNHDYQLIIANYFESVAKIDSPKKLAYTQSVMREISEFGLKDEDAYLINGTISTYYYSLILWNIESLNKDLREEK